MERKTFVVGFAFSLILIFSVILNFSYILLSHGDIEVKSVLIKIALSAFFVIGIKISE